MKAHLVRARQKSVIRANWLHWKNAKVIFWSRKNRDFLFIDWNWAKRNREHREFLFQWTKERARLAWRQKLQKHIHFSWYYGMQLVMQNPL